MHSLGVHRLPGWHVGGGGEVGTQVAIMVLNKSGLGQEMRMHLPDNTGQFGSCLRKGKKIACLSLTKPGCGKATTGGKPEEHKTLTLDR